MITFTPQRLRTEHLFYTILIISAIFSVGYYHPDEHYQIIEFAEMKLGHISATDLPWEYEEGIRPTLQPFICYLCFRFLSFFGIGDPYQLALFLRLLTALYAAVVVSYFVKNTQHLINPRFIVVYKLLSYFIWFIPFLSVRFSSETWAGLSFVLALTFFIKKTNSTKDFIIGCIFLSLSFQFRYQSAFLILGLLAWLIFVNKIRWERITLMALIFLVVTGWGLMIDRWFYGYYQLTFWNYFSVNILQDVASNFGTSPWYRILEYSIFAPTWPIGFLIILSVLILISLDYKSPFLWCIVPFVAVHMLIAHKELRFLFPIAWLIPLILLLGYQKLLQIKIHLIDILKSKRSFRLLCSVVLTIIALINVLALVIIITKPAGTGTKYITKHIQEKYRYQKIKLLYTSGNDPYAPWSFLNESFYSNKNVSTKKISSSLEAQHNIPLKDSILLVCVTENESENIIKDCKLSKNEVFLEAQSSPKWSQEFLRYYSNSTDKNLILLRIVRKQE